MDLSVIIPMVDIDEKSTILYKNAITSIEQQIVKPTNVLIVTPKGSDIENYVKTFDYGDISNIVKFISNDGKTDFQSQINLGVSKCETEWFSILEFDDEYSKIWFKNVKEYIEAYEDIDMFTPIIVDTDTNGGFMGFTNEIVWAYSFSDELGILDNQALLANQNFSIDGLVMRKETFENHGGLKSNIKLVFTYEFLLRMTFKGIKIMTIPRFGYRHTNNREGSLFHNYKLEMTPVEANWWLSKAKTEYHHTKDRELDYNA